jgi:hypothetical protein
MHDAPLRARMVKVAVGEYGSRRSRAPAVLSVARSTARRIGSQWVTDKDMVRHFVRLVAVTDYGGQSVVDCPVCPSKVRRRGGPAHASFRSS